MTHLSTIAAMPCVLCYVLGQSQSTPTQCHHIREGQGMAQRAHDELAIPLCDEHHTGPRGIHGDRSLLRIAKVDELDLLALTIRRLTGIPEPIRRARKRLAKSAYGRPAERQARPLAKILPRRGYSR